MANWTAADIPSQRGRTVVVTGTGGLGFQCALALAHAGANVVVAGRSPSKGAAAVERIRRSVARAKVSFEFPDLASLESIDAFGHRLRNSRRPRQLPGKHEAASTRARTSLAKPEATPLLPKFTRKHWMRATLQGYGSSRNA